MTYAVREFNLPELKGLSKEQIDVHLKLYEGYVKHTNLIMDHIKSLADDTSPEATYTKNELRRRLGFEFDGMRMHASYFEQLEGGAKDAAPDSPLADAANEKYGSWDGFIAHVKDVAGTRGIGWVVVYFDAVGSTLHTAFVNDHELGQLAGLPIILAVDLWEHAFMVDYVPAEKKTYVDAFLDNVNWTVVDRRMTRCLVP